MRLTLRTMLAYLDDILEPTDRDDIGHKIEESQFALQLVQRVRDCTRKARLSAPPLAGKGMDPNTVAEYLDNTLAGERVPDFEKVCLESDVYLAEVAACHQILTMVLGQPAQINPEMKNRMYEIGNQSAAAPAEELKLAPAHDKHAAIPDELWVQPARSKPEIPDYLRQTSSQWSWKTMIAGIALLAILAGAVTMALGPWETNPIAGLLGLRSAKETKVADNGSNAQALTPSAPANESTVAAPASAEGMTRLTQPNAATGGIDAAGHAAGPKAGDIAEGSTVPVAPLPDSTSAQAPGAVAQNLPGPATNANLPAIVPPAPNSSAGIENRVSDRPKPDDMTLPPELPQPVASVPAAVPNQTLDPGRMASRPEVPAPGDVTLNPPKKNTDDQSLLPQEGDLPLGRFLPGKTVVLLKFDPASQQWSRLPQGASLNSGDQLLVLPTYRPTLTLSAGLTLQLSPETMIQLQAPDALGVPGIKMLFGRLVALTTGKAGTRIRLTVGNTSGVLAFADADATLGLEVRRFLAAGTNPESHDSAVIADLYAASGHFEWTPAGGKPVTLTAPQRWTLSGNPTDAVPVGPTPTTLPKWINSPEPLNSLDENVSEFLAGNLEGGKLLSQLLLEMTSNRRVEYRAIGAQCLALLDDFEPLVSAFRDEGHRTMWPTEIASVRAALARGPTTAAKFRAACEKQFGDDAGKDFYRMFWGYTKEQLQSDQGAKLVGYLDNDELAFRAVAIADLQEITGRSLGFTSYETPLNRRQPLRRWQDELRTGKIVPRETAPRQ